MFLFLLIGNEKLSEKYKQEPKLSFVIKAIYTMAYGLHALQKDTCGANTVGLCPAMFPFNGTQFLVCINILFFNLEIMSLYIHYNIYFILL